MRKFNILFSNSNPKQMWGGGEKWMVMAAEGLQQRGHKCIMAARKNSQILKKSEQAGLKTKVFELHSELNIFKILSVAIYLKRNRIDIVIPNITKDVRMVGIAAKLAGVKLIVARHGAFMISAKFRYKWTYNLLVDKIITNSNAIKKYYDSFGWMQKDKVKVVLNGVEIPQNIETIDLRAKYNLEKDIFLFGVFGRLASQKGLDVLIKAIPLVKNDNFVVLLFGEGNQRSLLEKMINDYELQKKVFLKGHLDNVYPYMSGVDCTILSSYSEGMPNTVLESMLLGKLVISTNIVDMPEIVKDGEEGLIVKVGDEESLAKAMERAIEEFSNLKKFGKNAQKKAKEEYTLDKMISNIEDLFYSEFGEK